VLTQPTQPSIKLAVAPPPLPSIVTAPSPKKAVVVSQFDDYGQEEGDKFDAETLNLPESTILRLVDVALEEHVIYEVKHSKGKNIWFEFEALDSFKLRFGQFMHLQYGFQPLAKGYQGLLISKLKALSETPLNQYARILYMLFCGKTAELPGCGESRVWSREEQRVAIYALIMYQEVAKQQEKIYSPRQKAQLQRLGDVTETLRTGGHQVSIFEIADVITKQYPVAPLSIKIMQNFTQ